MKILMLTDIHSNYDAARLAYKITNPDFVLDCGDHFDLMNLFDFTNHLYVFGNHEPKSISVKFDSMPLPTQIFPGVIYNLSKNNDFVKVAGVGGNYSSSDSLFHVTSENIRLLNFIPQDSIDVLLLHESPYNVDGELKNLANFMLKEIDRIKPKFVFCGHVNKYRENYTSQGVKIMTLDDISTGYSILSVSKKKFNLERVISYYK